MLVENCCGQTPHEHYCVVVNHCKEDEEKIERPSCGHCGAPADTFFFRWPSYVGCDSCTDEIDRENYGDN